MGGLNGYIANLQLLLNQAAAYLDWEALDLTKMCIRDRPWERTDKAEALLAAR